MRPMNPYEGNGLLHPVYITPLMMHQLEQAGPQWTDPNMENAKAGNLFCDRGLTVECDGPKPAKAVCFAGCADVNPCDTNLYSSFLQGDAACDGSSFFYYTCEAFEELTVFEDRCKKHPDPGAKIDVAKGVDPEYKVWTDKVRTNRRNGKGRDIIYDDGDVADQPGGFSMGAGEYGNVPMTDEDLGNVADSMEGKYKLDKAQGGWGAKQGPNDMVGFSAQREDGDLIPFGSYNDHLVSSRTDEEVLEWMVIGLWSLCLLTLTCCLCCIVVALWMRCKRKRKQIQIERDTDFGGDSEHRVHQIEMAHHAV